MKKLIIAAVMTITAAQAQAKEVVLVTSNDGDRWTIDLDSYEVKKDTAWGLIYEYSGGKRLTNAVVVNCASDRGGQMIWMYSSGKDSVLFWSADGTRVYDGIGALMCAGNTEEAKPAGAHKW